MHKQRKSIPIASPHGGLLFLAWYDRCNDTNNEMVEIYGSFASLPLVSGQAFTNNFKLSNTSFPLVFAGTTKTNLGEFDPVYPPQNRTDVACPVFNGDYSGEVGDYDGIAADARFIYFSWSDGRRFGTNVQNSVVRNQTDVRLRRIPWPK